jgi:hypothetical protein
MMKLTQRTIDSLVLPVGKTDAIYFDDSLPGFGIRLRVGGSRMYYVIQYEIGGKQRRIRRLDRAGIVPVESWAGQPG